MANTGPRLIDTGDAGEAIKPDELDGQDITILRAFETRRQDGTIATKWVVRRADGSTGIYWSAGQDPTMKVAVWFMEHPNLPCPCRVFKRPNKYNTPVWCIEQRDVAETATNEDSYGDGPPQADSRLPF